MLSRQKLFCIIGATHSVAVYDVNMRLLSFAEDVGRHNAMDKCIGKLLIENKNNAAFIAILSSRLSYEMIMKACVLGLQIIAGVSALTSLAFEIAKNSNLTLIGFLRHENFNMYCCPQRLIV